MMTTAVLNDAKSLQALKSMLADFNVIDVTVYTYFDLTAD